MTSDSGTPNVLQAAEDAVAHTRADLFPFRFEHWLVLGLTAFLDQCGRGGASMNFPGNSGGSDGNAPDFGQAGQWLLEHFALVVGIVVVVVVLLLLLTALAAWIGSRGAFVYLDQVAHGHSELARPWREQAGHARSYFPWAWGLTLSPFVLVLGMICAVAALFLLLPRGDSSILIVVLAGIAALLALLAALVALSICSLVLHDFVAPIQVASGRPCGEAIREAQRLIVAHPLQFFIYLLLKMALGVMTVMATVITGCLTCCCGFLPVISHTILQPLHYFDRAWSLHVLRQLGHDLIGGRLAPSRAEAAPLA